MTGSDGSEVHDDESDNPPSKFQPTDRTKSTPSINLPDESWMTVLESPCTFPPEIFADVMLNLVKNPNVTSSHLFRADIYYDSDRDPSTSQDEAGNITEGALVKQLKAISRPIRASMPDCILVRTIVRELIPRNPQLDQPLVQTCHFFQRRMSSSEEENIVLYIPHVKTASEMPFYHPKMQRLAFHHKWQHDENAAEASRSVSLSFQFFREEPMSNKLSRTALRLLQTIHKHGQGRLAGYEKKVHLDQIIPQKRYQDTYTRLKSTYGKKLTSEWVEVTDPGKHVFEDLGIAAFLIELWRDTYNTPNGPGDSSTKADFPGFVDVGCGNGLLTHILISEGFDGWGFDARQRKSWLTFPENVQACLQRRFLIPDLSAERRHQEEIEKDEQSNGEHRNQTKGDNSLNHNGIFTPRTFIISNHTDELTAWTPLLAYLNESAFIAIPCCSHDLSGARFRAPPSTKSSRRRAEPMDGKQVHQPDKEGEGLSKMAGLSLSASSERQPVLPSSDSRPTKPSPIGLRAKQASETGSLRDLRSAPTSTTSVPGSSRADTKQDPNIISGEKPGSGGSNKMPSAYSTLCSYVESLATELGFVAEKDVLRIPSTRNACIIGRRFRDHRPDYGEQGKERGYDDGGRLGVSAAGADNSDDSLESRKNRIRELVEVEMGKTWESVIGDWKGRIEKLGKKPGSGH